MLTLWILQLAIKHLQPMSFYYLVHSIKLPGAIVRPLLQELVQANLLIETKEGTYFPVKNELRVSEALEALEGDNNQADLPFLRAKELAQFERAFHSFRECIERSPENFLICK